MEKAITLNNKKNITRTVAQMLCLIMILSFCFMAVPATYCTETEGGEDSATGQIGNIFVEMITDMSSEIYKTMRAIVIPIIACFVGYAGFCALTGGSKGTEKCVGILKMCVFGVCLVAFAPMLAQQIGNWVSNSYAGDLNSYNPLGS